MISEFLVSKELLHFDIPFLFIATVLVIIFFRSKMKLGKKEAIALIVIYGIYAALKIFGGAIF